jgi:hypothetical protein
MIGQKGSGMTAGRAANALLCIALLAAIVAFAMPQAAHAAGPTVTVKSATLNVRAGPGTNYAAIGSAKKGQTLEGLGRSADSKWVQVCCVASKQGWLSATGVTVQGGIAALPVVKAPAAPPTAAKAGKGPRPPTGTLLYSVVNLEQDRWELWEYSFATGKSRFLKEWRTEVAFSRDYKQVLYYVWGDEENSGIYAANAADLSGERPVIKVGVYYP